MNDSGFAGPDAARLATLVEVFRSRALLSPDRVAYGFLADGEAESARLTYAELDRAARAIAVALRQVVDGDGRALLLYPPGLDFVAAFVGCLYAGVVAVPTYPPHPARPARTLPRLLAIAGDAEIDAVLTSASIAGALRACAPDLGRLPWLATDRIPLAQAEQWETCGETCGEACGEARGEARATAPDAVAFLQYTSGSTAAPRGVMVTHANLAHNLACIRDYAGNTAASCGVSWLPACHDMGLIEGILQPAFAGYPGYLMSPLAFLERPVRWLAAISRYRASNSGAPNFAYDLCVRRIPREETRSLDLASWRIAYNGAEPVRADSLERFAAAFGGCGFDARAFRPAYGLAEATLLVASVGTPRAPLITAFDPQALAQDRARPAADGAAVRLVACGTPAYGTDVAIADPQRHVRLPPGEVGEIWVRGPSVARGYWGRPSDTAASFHARLDDGVPYLRTGDLGVIWDGELYVTGRIKDAIVVRGRKLYPQDIEHTAAAAHACVREGCVAAFACDDGERVGVAAEVEDATPDDDLDAIIAAIRDAVARGHGVQAGAVWLLARGTLPKTTSGKLRRQAARAGLDAATLAARARWSSLREAAEAQ